VTEIAEQLAFFAENGHNGNAHVASKSEVGLAKAIGPGAERLLAELVKRGLDQEHLRPTAALVLALEEWET
jgi:hypothetical protein